MNYSYNNYQPYSPMGMPNYNQPSYYPLGNNMGNINQPIQQTQSNDPSIQLCDSADYIKSQNTRLDGQPTYYALTDGSEIYCKKLNPMTGAGVVLKYTLDNSETNTEKNDLSSTISKMQLDIAELKEMVLDSLTVPTKGGEKK